MSTTYAQRQISSQKKDASSASSVLDSSSQSESLQRKANLVDGVVQRRKNDDERASKARRVDHAKKNIQIVSGLTFASEDHIFQGEEDSSGQLTGLHAYIDKQLPNGVNLYEGTPKNVVHDIVWYKTDVEKRKRSTMFPSDMPKNHVKTLIALKWPREFGLEEGALKFPEDTREYIKHGRSFDVRKAGDVNPTFYPERE